MSSRRELCEKRLCFSLKNKERSMDFKEKALELLDNLITHSVNVKNEKLKMYNATISKLCEAIANSNFLIGLDDKNIEFYQNYIGKF